MEEQTFKIGKYEFESKEQASEFIDSLGYEDQEGVKVPTHQNDVVVLGCFLIEDPEFDSEGNIIKDAVLSHKFAVDVAWRNGEEPENWTPLRVEVEGEGVHSFSGISYQENKL